MGHFFVENYGLLGPFEAGYELKSQDKNIRQEKYIIN